MKKVDWSYHRAGCKTCGKTQAYLEKAGIVPKVQVDARKETMDADAAIALAKQAAKVHATKGKKVVVVDLKKDKPTDDTLRSLVVGPSGNLRAPSLMVGKNLIVGFDEEMYDSI